MHSRRVATFILGLWFAGMLCIGASTVIGYRVVDQSLKLPPQEISRSLSMMGEALSQQMVNYFVSEINRSMFEIWGFCEMILVAGLGIYLVLYNQRMLALTLTALMMLSACGSHFLVTPQVIAIGRILDFQPPTQLPHEHSQY